MPNWCHNKLTITGSPEEVEELIEFVAGEDKEQLIDFQNISPMPEALEETDADDTSGEDNWYLWRIRHWGTKANAHFEAPAIVLAYRSEERPEGLTSVFVPGEALFVFLTAWSPCAEVITTLAKRFCALTLQLVWAEVGHGSAGRVTWQDGRIVEDIGLGIDEALDSTERWF